MKLNFSQFILDQINNSINFFFGSKTAKRKSERGSGTLGALDRFKNSRPTISPEALASASS